jgi:hypothetical protein
MNGMERPFIKEQCLSVSICGLIRSQRREKYKKKNQARGEAQRLIKKNPLIYANPRE